MLSNVGYLKGKGRQFLVAPSVIRSPLTLTRAQLAGVEVLELGETIFINYVAPNVLLAPLTLTRAQAAGVEVLEDA